MQRAGRNALFVEVPPRVIRLNHLSDIPTTRPAAAAGTSRGFNQVAALHAKKTGCRELKFAFT
jgi:hypothetical protein